MIHYNWRFIPLLAQAIQYTRNIDTFDETTQLISRRLRGSNCDHINSGTVYGIVMQFLCIVQHAIHGALPRGAYATSLHYRKSSSNAACCSRLAMIEANREENGEEGERDPGGGAVSPAFFLSTYLPTYPCYVYLIGPGRT